MAHILVTGANRGIGLEFCRQLSKRGDKVIAACRNSSEELDSLDVQVETNVDLTKEETISPLAKKLFETRLDLLIQNAGILQLNTLDNLDFQSLRRQFEVNTLGPLRLTRALLPYLKEGTKIAFITSRMGSMSDNTSGSSYGYRMSKAALNMASISLAHDLKERKIAVGLFHPGFVKTAMTGFQGSIKPEDAVENLLKRFEELSLENSGGFWHANGEKLPW